MEKMQPPEEIELHLKEELLKKKQEILTERELALSTLQADLHTFEIEYYLRIGEKYVLIDRLKATLDNIIASKFPKDLNARKQAEKSNKKAKESEYNFKKYQQFSEPKQNKFEATPVLKSLYRELAKLLHPDLTLDKKEKERRHKLMQFINETYQLGDLKKLQDIWELEKNNPEHIKGDDIGSALIRTIRKIAQVEKRIVELEHETKQLQKTDLFALYQIFTRDVLKGIERFQILSAQLQTQIEFLQNEIEQISKK